jgi:hypothetical protein
VKRGAITKARLLAELDRRSRKFLAQSPQPFVLLAPLSFRYFPGLHRKVVGGWSLTFSDGSPQRFRRDHVPPHVWSKYDDAHLRMAHVRVSGMARTISEAQEVAMERLDCLRGIWNFVLNRLVWSELTSDQDRAINKIKTGPVYTVHRPDGSSAADVWWYEIVPTKDPFSVDLSGKWQQIERVSASVRAAISETKLGPDLRKLFVRYCRALDGIDHDVTILHLWGILETLTATGSERYDTTIQRVRFCYGDEPLPWYVLELLRERRNRIAHAGMGGSDARTAALQLHRYVAALLTFAIQVSGRFTSLEEFGQFLSMPSDAAKLRNEIAMRRAALRYQGPGLHGRKLVRK